VWGHTGRWGVSVRQDSGVTKQRADTFVAARLEQARRAAGYSQAQLAIRADISLSTISSYVLGRSTPPAPVIVRLAEALGVATTDLAPLSQDPPLRELIWHAGLLVEDVAPILNRSLLHTGAILRGDFPVPDPEALAEALGVTPDQITAAWQAARRERLDG
jgi:transcriptional regulator with XRE-family HTH domain